jgi:hypothetical protein
MGYCRRGKKSVPVNKKVYNSIKRKIKRKSKVWPSAYASGRLVRMYKARGGKYRCRFGKHRTGKLRTGGLNRHPLGGLDRWFKEKWVNVCEPNGKGGYKPCGRSKSSRKKYPYCRPSVWVNKGTPTRVSQIKGKIKRMCSKKRKNPYRRIFLLFGKKKSTLNTLNTLHREIRYLQSIY